MIKSLREGLGMSQRELAAWSGVRQPVICAVEAGREALPSTYRRLAEAMGFDFVYHAVATRPREQILAELFSARVAAEDAARVRRQARRLMHRSR
ncbi:MAG: helix-turn-helix transcriptional regulator [Elusimicrobia bacterium]|nr:helix-turn-helix transcriptional regulator [Elusimicrobiota bacterium]